MIEDNRELKKLVTLTHYIKRIKNQEKEEDTIKEELDLKFLR